MTKQEREEREDGKQLYKAMTANCPEAIVNWGSGNMIYIGEQVYLKSNGVYVDEDDL